MEEMRQEAATRTARKLSVVCAAIVFVVGLAVLAGWVFDLPLLRRAFLGEIDVRPNTALALACASLSVIFLNRRAGRLLGLVPLAFGASTCVEYLFDVDFGLGTLLVDPYDPALPMRISVRAAITSTFAGLALLFATRRMAGHLFGGAAAFIATLSALAFAYGATFLPGADVTPMALSAALLFVLWSVAYFAATSDRGFMVNLLHADEWGAATRRLSLVALFVPALFGAICLLEVHQHLFDFEFAVALITTGTSFTLFAVITRYTAQLREQEKRRAAADAMYRTIVETSQEGICLVSDQRFTFVNERLAQMLGYTQSEMIGMNTLEIVDESEHEAVRERAEIRRASGSSTRTTVQLKHRDGSIVHAISAATGIDLPGNPNLLLATLSDITDRVEQEAALRASEARFRSLYETNLVGVAFWSLDGVVTDANDAFLKQFDITPADLPWRWNERNTPEGEATDAAAMWHIRESGRCDPFEKEFIRPSGSRFSTIIALARVDSETNIAFVLDVTERTEARRSIERAHEILSARLRDLEGESHSGDPRELETLVAQLAQANEELETFSYSVSHDLRAPLRAIDGFTRELQLSYTDKLDELGVRYLGRVRTATQRMSQLIDDLLSLSRLSRKPMRRTTVDVSTVANEVATEARERVGGEVTFTIEPGLTASADPQLLRVVLENLIGNAVKFSSRTDNARVEVFREGQELVVRDNGAGFDPQFAHKIFAPFQRLHSTEFEGTGIGLALVQRIVRRHGGNIRAQSAPGEGATFSFTLSNPRETAA